MGKILIIIFSFIVFCANPDSAFSQIGIGFRGDGDYVGTIGTNKGGVEAYKCPAGTVLRGLYHADVSMNSSVTVARGMTAQVGLYCASISVLPNGTVETTQSTADGTPTVLGFGYGNQGTLRNRYCPSGQIIQRLGGYDRRTAPRAFWASSLRMACRPLQLGASDWVEVQTTATAGVLTVGVNEGNATHRWRGWFCSNTANSAASGVHRQAGGRGP